MLLESPNTKTLQNRVKSSDLNEYLALSRPYSASPALDPNAPARPAHGVPKARPETVE